MSDYPFEWCKQHTTRSNTCKDCEIEYLFTEHIRLRVIEGAARAVLRNPLNIGLLQRALEDNEIVEAIEAANNLVGGVD